MISLKPQSLIERLLWLDPPNHKHRQEPMQIICVGPSRSGTESLARALDILGYKTYHGFRIMTAPADNITWWRFYERKFLQQNSPPLTAADFDTLLAPFTAITDMPGVAFARDLILAYPDAKVILNTRDVDEWYPSYERNIIAALQSREGWFAPLQVLSYFGALRYWSDLCGVVTKAFWRSETTEQTRARAKWAYEEHVAMVRGLVSGEKGRLLEWRVEDGWEPLCGFLGKRVPEGEEFPSGNVSAETGRKIVGFLEQGDREAWRNLGIVVGGLVVGVGAVGWGVWRWL